MYVPYIGKIQDLAGPRRYQLPGSPVRRKYINSYVGVRSQKRANVGRSPDLHHGGRLTSGQNQVGPSRPKVLTKSTAISGVLWRVRKTY